MQKFRLYWLRESAPNHLDADLGLEAPASHLELALLGLLSEQQPVPQRVPLDGAGLGAVLASTESLRAVPNWARKRLAVVFGRLHTDERMQLAQQGWSILQDLCARIRRAADSAAELRLFLPAMNRKDWNRRFDFWSRLDFARVGDAIVPHGFQPFHLENTLMRLAASLYQPLAPLWEPLEFAEHRPIAAPWAYDVMRRHGVELPAQAEVRQLRLRLPGNAVECWRRLPKETEPAFFGVFWRMSLSLQKCFRRWALATHFRAAHRVEDVDSSLDVLTYAATPAFAQKATLAFTCDVLNEKHITQVFQQSAERLPTLLERFGDSLVRRGRRDLARQYQGRDYALQGARIATRALRQPRVRQMLVAEAAIIEALIHFAQKCRSVQLPRHLWEEVSVTARVLRDRLQRLMPDENPERYGQLVLVEATHALHQAVGGEACLTLDLDWRDETPLSLLDRAA
jgi:hypothetical protein